jgi:hypothetical protein
MFKTRADGAREPTGRGFSVNEFSTDPRQLYVSYLTANELAASIERIDRKLLTTRHDRYHGYSRLLRDIRTDLLKELGSRQLRILEDGTLGER